MFKSGETSQVASKECEMIMNISWIGQQLILFTCIATLKWNQFAACLYSLPFIAPKIKTQAEFPFTDNSFSLEYLSFKETKGCIGEIECILK